MRLLEYADSPVWVRLTDMIKVDFTCSGCGYEMTQPLNVVVLGDAERITEGTSVLSGFRCDECGRWQAFQFMPRLARMLRKEATA